jgi:glycerate kinase
VKIVIAPDSFKGNLSAAEVCSAVASGIKDVFAEAEIVSIPLADGGEGTARAITLAAGGQFRKARVTGPLGTPVEAEFGLIRGGSVAVLDMASASGIELVPSGKLDPMAATTYGTGELLLAALDAGAREVVLGIGGSATVDGGVGMALALGFQVLDEEGKPVPLGGAGLSRVASVARGGADPRLEHTKILVACDVTNPLLGPKGAAAVFGPQKGATEKTVPVLEAGLARLADAWKKAGMVSDVEHPGDGAAGGLGAALRAFLVAEMRSGARTVMEYAGFGEAVAGADFVITGEGMTDAQTAGGKLCSVVAEECRKRGVPVVLISGGLGGDVLELLSTYDYAVSTSCGQTSLEAMIRDAPRDLRFAAANLVRAFRLGAASAVRR